MLKWLKSLLGIGLAWLKDILKSVMSRLADGLKQLGKENVAKVKAFIIKVNAMDIPNKEKFAKVVAYVKELAPKMKDSIINLIAESLVNELKKRGEIA